MSKLKLKDLEAVLVTMDVIVNINGGEDFEEFGYYDEDPKTGACEFRDENNVNLFDKYGNRRVLTIQPQQDTTGTDTIIMILGNEIGLN